MERAAALRVAVLTTYYPRDEQDSGGLFVSDLVTRLEARGSADRGRAARRLQRLRPRVRIRGRQQREETALGGAYRWSPRCCARFAAPPRMPISFTCTGCSPRRSGCSRGKPWIVTLHGTPSAGAFEDLVAASACAAGCSARCCVAPARSSVFAGARRRCRRARCERRRDPERRRDSRRSGRRGRAARDSLRRPARPGEGRQGACGSNGRPEPRRRRRGAAPPPPPAGTRPCVPRRARGSLSPSGRSSCCRREARASGSSSPRRWRSASPWLRAASAVSRSSSTTGRQGYSCRRAGPTCCARHSSVCSRRASSGAMGSARGGNGSRRSQLGARHRPRRSARLSRPDGRAPLHRGRTT